MQYRCCDHGTELYIHRKGNGQDDCICCGGNRICAVSDHGICGQAACGTSPQKGQGQAPVQGIHVLALLDEEDRIISEWNIGGKISVLIGRDSAREDVDINLSNTAFGGMVDRQHAVLNYTAGQWYIEDLDSANGIRIQKKDGRLYEVSKTQPCLVEQEDILYIGLTKLQTR